jgi:hypothetical protein
VKYLGKLAAAVGSCRCARCAALEQGQGMTIVKEDETQEKE